MALPPCSQVSMVLGSGQDAPTQLGGAPLAPRSIRLSGRGELTQVLAVECHLASPPPPPSPPPSPSPQEGTSFWLLAQSAEGLPPPPPHPPAASLSAADLLGAAESGLAGAVPAVGVSIAAAVLLLLAALMKRDVIRQRYEDEVARRRERRERRRASKRAAESTGARGTRRARDRRACRAASGAAQWLHGSKGSEYEATAQKDEDEDAAEQTETQAA
jgi:hypothetical protein